MNILEHACRKEPAPDHYFTSPSPPGASNCKSGAGSPANLAAYPVQNPQAGLSSLAHDRIDNPGDTVLNAKRRGSRKLGSNWLCRGNDSARPFDR